jgi:hypothetical protein
MAEVSISEAIALFDHSETARGAMGAVAKWPLRVVEKLRYLHDTDEAGFAQPQTKSKTGIVRGEWLEGREGYDLRVNPSYIKSLPEKDRLPAVSLILVHEGVHAFDSFERLYDEMMARKVPIYYYRELSGQGVLNVLTGKRIWLGKSTHFDAYSQQSRYLDKDQLVDYVLSIDSYTGRSYIDAQWVLDNHNHWGGIKNRWAATKRLYVKILLPAARDTYFAAPILTILESIEAKAEWDKMIGAIKEVSRNGSLRTLQVSLDLLLGDRHHAARISHLERRWGTALTDTSAVTHR